jgi:peptidoglycan/LPS O-acetylase OafA/YrhL
MKRPVIIFIVAALVIISTGLWFYSSMQGFNSMDILQFGVIFMLVAFALFLGIKRLRSVKRGEPAEDELSKKVLQRTAAISYYISLYIWVFLIWLKDRVTFDTEELLGTGILAMAVTFGITWLVLNYRGIRNE